MKNLDESNVTKKEYQNDNNVFSTKIPQTNKTLNDQPQPSVIYIGHLPPEFQENEILTFFSQFGDVRNIHLSRSQRTLRSRGYAFIKFSEVDVASIAAQTMNGYLLMGRRKLVSHILTSDKLHPNMFRNKKLYFPHNEDVRSKLYLQRKNTINQVNSSKDSKKMKRISQRLLRAEKKKRKILAHMDIDYDYPGYFSSCFSANNSRQSCTKALESQEKSRKNSIFPDRHNIDACILKSKPIVKSTSTRKEKKNDLIAEIAKERNISIEKKKNELIHFVEKSSPKKKNETITDSTKQILPKNVNKMKCALIVNKKSVEKQKKITVTTDDISVKSFSSKCKDTFRKNRKTKKIACVQDEPYNKNDLQKNEKLLFPTEEVKNSIIADTSVLKLRLSKCDERVCSTSKKEKSKINTAKLQQGTPIIAQMSNEDILLSSSRSESNTKVCVKITSDPNHNFISSISNQHICAEGKKRQTVKGTALFKQLVTDNDINKLRDISFPPKKKKSYKHHDMKLLTMVDKSPSKLSSESGKITGKIMSKKNCKTPTNVQKIISRQSDVNSPEMFPMFQDKGKKDRKTKLKVSTVTVASPVKLRSSRSCKILKTVSKRKKARKDVGPEKLNVMKNELEKMEENKLSLTKGTKDVSTDGESTVKLRRSKRTRK